MMQVGLLNAYHFDRDPNSYRATYRPMCVSYLERVLPDTEIQVFEVAQDEWPKSVTTCDAWIITGSSKSAYEEDQWILQLQDFVRQCDDQKQKLIGICFGHQLVAQALGGRVEKSPKGWGVGVREFDILKSKPWMKPELSKCALLFSHQDQVMEMPKGSELLGRDQFCEIQMYSLGDHIFCIQGHPEFTVEYAKSRVEARKERIGKETVEAAMASFSRPQDELEVGEWMHRFIQK